MAPTSLLAGCGQSDARGLAHQACGYIATALKDEATADHDHGRQAKHLRFEALQLLEKASPIAGVAAGEDSEWEALQATLGEIGQVPVTNLTHALAAQCASPTGDG